MKHHQKFNDDVRKSVIYQNVWKHKKEYFEANKLFMQVLEALATHQYEDQKLFEYEIDKQNRENTK